MNANEQKAALSRRSFVCRGTIVAMGIAAGLLPRGAWGAETPEPVIPTQERDVAPSTCGALRVEGAQLVAEDGAPVQLRGVSTHGLAWFPQFVNEDCFRQLHDEWGASVVRLAMYTAESGGWCTDGDRDQLRALIDTGVQAATAADLYVIVDWHILSDNDPNTYRDDAVAFFDEMSARYAGQNNVLYEICNEPNGATTWQDVKDYAASVIPAIRANAADAVILVGTPTWSQRVDEAAADPITGFDNLMYTLHFYAATHKDDLRATLATAVEDGLPVFVSEFGICDASGNGTIDEGQADEWVALLDRLGISYVMWSLSNRTSLPRWSRARATRPRALATTTWPRRGCGCARRWKGRAGWVRAMGERVRTQMGVRAQRQIRACARMHVQMRTQAQRRARTLQALPARGASAARRRCAPRGRRTARPACSTT